MNNRTMVVTALGFIVAFVGSFALIWSGGLAIDPGPLLETAMRKSLGVGVGGALLAWFFLS